MSKGYWVACVNVKNQVEFKKYVDLAGPAINLHGGKFLVRGGKVLNIEGKKYERIVVSVFDSPEKAKECYKSKEYQHAYSFLNDEVAERIIHIAEGMD
ncbi:MAG: DUF1330 domain-containing protein [Pelagibacteraceae bacterium]|jgi:uncharacterized protein (DUF1330 family)|nr:DUF1330 domain-containing protein [Pelagibacteraceae bacterium]MDP6784171.1 DUF1330 domain-containing protein [Alphaproteobacteria bacterium]MBO6466441.1 DUF1330 domain-containing protein [Pelagibacteraceae bacterium]MBO6467747.1 DUF1330 domain-containing protein [Pelagibacteraceae bacterium]MBO6469477.1 DUF1330 domain-containing protein [Pelagibacteraceae bacterium]|tara:strand:- start:42 stop:335 length:294 start_codon:yes stop_codon:yes gene_type:complete